MRVPSFPVMLRKSFSCRRFLREFYSGNIEHFRILNVGASGDRIEGTISLDINPARGTDVVADGHKLPFADASFDLVICTGTLQYCVEPRAVIAEMRRVLRLGGVVYIDAPFVQPYCDDSGADLWRFSQAGLRRLFADWYVVGCDVSIPAGPAMADLGQIITRELPLHRVPKYLLTWLVSLVFWPLTLLRLRKPAVAGAHYLIAMNV